MQDTNIQDFHIIGISVRTSNQNNQAQQDIGALWGTFMKQGIVAQTPNKIDDTIYALYTEYEGDHKQPYTTIIGCKVKSLENIPEELIGKSFQGGKYRKFQAKGDITQGVVAREWYKIWQSDLDRRYTVDFEIYGEAAKDPKNAEIDILIAVK